MFILQCGRCLQQVNVAASFAGQNVKCPVCGDAISVPWSARASGAPVPAPAAADPAVVGASVGGASGTGTWSAPQASAGGSDVPAWARPQGSSVPATGPLGTGFVPGGAAAGAGSGWNSAGWSSMPPTPGTPKSSRLVYVLLAIFLGTLGIHNFVAGHTSRGVTQLAITIGSVILAPCTAGISLLGLLATFIWSLVDIVTVDRDANNVAMN